LQILEDQKNALRAYFDERYPATERTTPSARVPANSTNSNGTCTGPINFAAFDQGPDNDTDMDELDTYFEAPRIPYHMDPIQWWYARRSEYPLYQFARDIMFVSVTEPIYG
jgi:hypothetical protein